eukprot:COSAG02_NODE_17386_length_1007_cov_4.525330_1_plen_87_part_00
MLAAVGSFFSSVWVGSAEQQQQQQQGGGEGEEEGGGGGGGGGEDGARVMATPLQVRGNIGTDYDPQDKIGTISPIFYTFDWGILLC